MKTYWVSRDDFKDAEVEIWGAEPELRLRRYYSLDGSGYGRAGIMSYAAFRMLRPDVTLRPGQVKELTKGAT